MSDTDSFIEEVTEEVRRDQLYQGLRKYGWIGVLAVLVIVGGAGLREYNRAKATTAAQELGDQIAVALEAEDAAARAEALALVPASDAGAGAGVVVLMAQAGALVDSGDIVGAIAALDSIATNADAGQIYRDIAAFKSVALQAETLAPEERRLRLSTLAQPGAPLYLLASEQLALVDLQSGDTEAAVARLEEIAASAGVSRGLLERVNQLLLALGVDPDAASAETAG